MDNPSMPPCVVIPQLTYDDITQVIPWLCDTFGFAVRWQAGTHRAQLAVGDGAVVVTETRSSSAGSARQSVLVRVLDVAAQLARVQAQGVSVLKPIQDYPYGERQFTVRDPGGHDWTFSESIAEVAPETWGGSSGPALRQPAGAGALRPLVSVMLIVPDVEAALRWYAKAFGARELWNLGGVAGAEIGGAPFFLHATAPENRREADPDSVGATSVRIEVFVDDPEGLVARAAAAGAEVEPVRRRAIAWGEHRQGDVRDPFGHRWSIGDRSPLGVHPAG